MRRRRTSGFTLIEVLMAMAIIAMVVLLLLSRRGEIVQDAATMRDKRVAWVLASWKMGLLTLDPILFQSTGRSETGDFDDLSTDYKGYVWSYEALPEDIQLDTTPAATGDPSSFKKIFHIKLQVARSDAKEPLYVLEGMFPIQQAAAPAEPAPPSNP